MSYLNAIIKYGILLFVFLIPWQARLIISGGSINNTYWEYGTQSLYATEVLLLFILVAVVVRGIIYIRQSNTKFNPKKLYSLSGVLIAGVIWAGLSIIWSIDKGVAYEHWMVLVSAVVLVFILSSGMVTFTQIAWVVLFSATAQAVIGSIQFFAQTIPSSTVLGMAYQDAGLLGASVIETTHARWLRAYGNFPHPNILGAWLTLGLILIVERWQRFNLKDVWIYLMYIVLLFGLAVTFSRSAWLAFAIAFIYSLVRAFIQKDNFRHSIKLLALSFLVIGMFSLVYPDLVSSRIGGSNRLELISNQERVSSLSESWHIIKQHPARGVGIGNYGLGMYTYIDATQGAWHYQPVHNIPLLLLAEVGVVGFLLLGYALWLIGYYRMYARPLLEPGMILIPLFVLGMLDHYLWSLYAGMMILAVYVGLEIKRKMPNIS